MKSSHNPHCGLTEWELLEMREVFSQFPGVQKVILFGSRAKGTEKPGSDVDLVVEYTGNNPHDLFTLHTTLEEETGIPYFFDVVNMRDITSPELREHIREYGIQIF